MTETPHGLNSKTKCSMEKKNNVRGENVSQFVIRDSNFKNYYIDIRNCTLGFNMQQKENKGRKCNFAKMQGLF